MKFIEYKMGTIIADIVQFVFLENKSRLKAQ